MNFCKLLIISVVFTCLACNSDKGPNSEIPDLLSYRAAFSIQPLVRPIPLGESVVFVVEPVDSSKTFDSVHFQIDGKPFQKLAGTLTGPVTLKWSSAGTGTGAHVLMVIGKKEGQEPESASQTFKICAPAPPELYGYKIVKTLPHQGSSFTQGLEWAGSQLFEGTGLNGKSKVMEIDVATGKEIGVQHLEQEYFGEGITILNHKLYQLTWQNKKGFIYELPGLKRVGEFGYPTDGWGLTHIGNQLAMSDGSNKIYFLNPENFATAGSIEVWDNRNPVGALNELETVDGIMYANKYQTDTIVKIDPKTGQVLAYIDLSGILPDAKRTGEEDVLNGIAWHPQEKLFYITGKNYPYLFAVQFLKKQAI